MAPRLLPSFICLMLGACPVALAQTADAPVMGSAATDAQGSAPARDETNELQHILVVGDAVGGGFGAGLSRMAEADGRFDVSIRFNEESGLARPEVYDWAETLPKILESKTYSVIVAMMGTNDRQQIRDGNLRYAFNSPDWIAAYRQRLDQVLDALAASGARIYWVGIPPMANGDYDAAMQAISVLQKERAEAKGAVFLDFRSYLVNADGSYTDSGPDDTGAVRKLRGRDGVTFFKQGNSRMGQLIFEAISKGAPAPVSKPTVAPAVTVESGKGSRQPVAEAVVPVFGSYDAFGADVVIQPKDVSTAAVLASGAGPLPPNAMLSALQQLARPGSQAEQLFATGTAAAAPPGRADDFAAPPATP